LSEEGFYAFIENFLTDHPETMDCFLRQLT
jgi:hypothetical protein